MFNFIKRKLKPEFLKYSFINNSILLRMDTIIENGYKEVWRQSYRKDYGFGKFLCKFYVIMRKKKNSRLLTDIKDQAKGIPIPRFHG